MKPIQWDLASIPERFELLERFDFSDIDYNSVLVELQWEDLHSEIRFAFRQMPWHGPYDHRKNPC